MNWTLHTRMTAFIGVFRGAVKAVWEPHRLRPVTSRPRKGESPLLFIHGLLVFHRHVFPSDPQPASSSRTYIFSRIGILVLTPTSQIPEEQLFSTWPFSVPRPIPESSLESEVYLPATRCLGPTHIFIGVTTSSAHLDVATSPNIIFLFNDDPIPLTLIRKTAPPSTSCPAPPSLPTIDCLLPLPAPGAPASFSFHHQFIPTFPQ